MNINEIFEVAKDLVRPRKKGDYRIELNGGQLEFEGQTSHEAQERLYRFKAQSQRNKKYFGYY